MSSKLSNSSGSLAGQLGDISKYLEKLKEQRKELSCQLKDKEQEKNSIEEKIARLQREKAEAESAIDSGTRRLQQLDETINNAESTFMKLMDSSQALAALVKKESSELETVSLDSSTRDS